MSIGILILIGILFMLFWYTSEFQRNRQNDTDAERRSG